MSGEEVCCSDGGDTIDRKNLGVQRYVSVFQIPDQVTRVDGVAGDASDEVLSVVEFAVLVDTIAEPAEQAFKIALGEIA